MSTATLKVHRAHPRVAENITIERRRVAQRREYERARTLSTVGRKTTGRFGQSKRRNGREQRGERVARECNGVGVGRCAVATSGKAIRIRREVDCTTLQRHFGPSGAGCAKLQRVPHRARDGCARVKSTFWSSRGRLQHVGMRFSGRVRHSDARISGFRLAA